LGLAWLRDAFLPIVGEMRQLMAESRSERYPRAAAFLSGLVEFAHRRLVENADKFELIAAEVTTMSDPKKGQNPPPNDAAAEKGRKWDGTFTPGLYKKVLEETKAEERRQGATFPGGKPFPVPT